MTKGGAFLHGQSDQLKLCCGDNMKKLEIAFTDTREKVVIDWWNFWTEGYYIRIVGLNEDKIKKYIQDQEKHDIAMDKLSVKEYEDPFKG